MMARSRRNLPMPLPGLKTASVSSGPSATSIPTINRTRSLPPAASKYGGAYQTRIIAARTMAPMSAEIPRWLPAACQRVRLASLITIARRADAFARILEQGAPTREPPTVRRSRRRRRRCLLVGVDRNARAEQVAVAVDVVDARNRRPVFRTFLLDRRVRRDATRVGMRPCIGRHS